MVSGRAVSEEAGTLFREDGGIPGFIRGEDVKGVTLTLLGVMMLVVALVNFLQNRRTIDNEQFHPHVNFAIVLTLLASLIGILLAGYLLFTA